MPGQIHRDDETWAAIVAAWESSDLTTDAFAATTPGLSPRTLRSRIAKIIGNADPHRAALRLARQNDQLWAEIESFASRCTCRAAAESLVASGCRPAGYPSAGPTGQTALPIGTGPLGAGAAECHAAASDPDRVAASVPIDPFMLAPPQEKLPDEVVRRSMSDVAGIGLIREPPVEPKGRSRWNFDE